MGFGAIFGGGGASSALGSVATFFTSKLLQEDAQQFQTSFYKQRYQRQMEDMRKAGLNPILSYRTGVPGTASAGIAGAGGIAGAFPAGISAGAAASQATSAKKLRATQEGLIGAQIMTENEKQGLIRNQAIHSAAQARETDVRWKLGQTQLPKAIHQSNFYDSAVGKAAVNTQEAAGTARSVRSVFFGGR